MLPKAEVIKILKHHNKWRRGSEIEMVEPAKIGEAIQDAIAYLSTPEAKTSEDKLNGKNTV